MQNSKMFLNSILNTTQIGQIGIRSALDKTKNTDLHNALESQLKEYDAIESQAQNIAAEKGWHLKEVNPGMRAMANAMTRARLSHGDVSSKLAAMMIQGNTRGMIIGMKNRHKIGPCDGQVLALSQRLLDCESANIRQMQPYL